VETKGIEMITSKKQVDEIKGRCKVRVFGGDEVAQIVAEMRGKAAKSPYGVVATVRHGGGVANKYGYPATSQVVFIGATADGRAVVKITAITANKITYGGAIAAVMGDQSRPMCDERFGGKRTESAKEYVRQQVRLLCADPANHWKD
jgi:hypothetical protein